MGHINSCILRNFSTSSAKCSNTNPSRMDANWTCIGMDQHTNYSCPGILWHCVTCRDDHADSRQRSDAPLLFTRGENLQNSQNISRWYAYAATILNWGDGTMQEFVREIWEFLKERKKFWLLPIILFLGLLGTLIVMTEGSAVAPFIYTLF